MKPKRIRIRTEEQKERAKVRRRHLDFIRNRPKYQRKQRLRQKQLAQREERKQYREQLANKLRLLRQKRHNNEPFSYDFTDFILDNLTN